jgi:ABC-type antimicrobial peptide transport system permease subunit
VVAPIPDTIVRIVLLIVTTVIAGYLPSRMIVRKNTLDSILGRN